MVRCCFFSVWMPPYPPPQGPRVLSQLRSGTGDLSTFALALFPLPFAASATNDPHEGAALRGTEVLRSIGDGPRVTTQAL